MLLISLPVGASLSSDFRQTDVMLFTPIYATVFFSGLEILLADHICQGFDFLQSDLLFCVSFLFLCWDIRYKSLRLSCIQCFLPCNVINKQINVKCLMLHICYMNW